MTRLSWFVMAVLTFALAAMSIMYVRARAVGDSGPGLSGDPIDVAQGPGGPWRLGRRLGCRRAVSGERSLVDV